MSPMNTKKELSIARLLVASVLALFLTAAAHASAPGITGTGGTDGTFTLQASTAFLNQPDGTSVYAWGYGCVTTALPTAAQFQPKNLTLTPFCPTMQVPAPTMIVPENTTVTINLINNLPRPAGNTSILFPGLNATASAPAAASQPAGCVNPGAPTVAGLLTTEVLPGCMITYTLTAVTPGTHPIYSGTQSDLQIEMGLYGAIIVLPATAPACPATVTDDLAVETNWHESDFRNAATQGGTPPGAAYDNAKTCYNREYLFQWGEMDANIHKNALAQVNALVNTVACGGTAANINNALCTLNVPTEPYHPAYFVINGRSMPDLMDPNFASEYPHQPYNGDPHIHPGEMMLIRVIGQGRWQHPYHEHANHVRVLARDGSLVVSQSNANDLAGLLMFDTDTTPGEAFDGIFYFTGRGLNWDPYGHTPNSFSNDPWATLSCTPDANGYNTGYATDGVTKLASYSAILAAPNYYEWCQDHNKPVEANPFGDVASGGPATLPNPNIFTNGPWYGGTPYLGPDATQRSSSTLRPVSDSSTTSGNYGAAAGCSSGPANGGGQAAGGAVTQTPNAGCTNLQPSNIQANPGNERGWAFMWHSHNEREITTNNVFPGGMLMMLLVDSREFVIDETN